MRASLLPVLVLSLVGEVLGAPSLAKRDGQGQFELGKPISADGKGAEIYGE